VRESPQTLHKLASRVDRKLRPQARRPHRRPARPGRGRARFVRRRLRDPHACRRAELARIRQMQKRARQNVCLTVRWRYRTVGCRC
jgi:hypothetical protein